tara:strand:+ start:4181 stop:4750 length:570 start_codon:yes stop_codon:yes gene_type:complete
MEEKTNFVIKGFSIPISAGAGLKTHTISFPFDVRLIKAKYFDLPVNEGDILSVSVSPETIIGQIFIPGAIGTTTIYVTDTVVAYLKVGYGVSIVGGDGYQDLGMCIAIDAKAQTIRVEKEVTAPYSEGSAILMTAPLVDEVRFTGGGFVEPIDGTVKTKPLPANTPMVIQYNNSDGVSKVFQFNLEILF